ncbi:hypothetical protein DA718_26050 [Klebsiella huaxiensis]|uniref:Lipoprotein n=1 Tax=Klebsiella huaxiensis TaxID=2153354 RepID=A0ABT6EB90_9ENTR|nr:hypothetical protein [Klebsiella huaxiensis]MDG1640997.1 hypothetical protein [Klebsiella huaxiensis]QBG10375.1 hypothetical protein DA718_26050 [Klebsiella huaxiensis]
MKNTRYFTLNFTGFTTAASEKQSYLRLVAGDHVFYTDTRYFQDPTLFEQLKLNQPLHIGARRLPDGSFWIHWLSDGNVLLEPARPSLKSKLLMFFIGTLVFAAAAYPTYFYTTTWVVIVFGIIAALALVPALMGIGGLLHRFAQKIHPGMRGLMARMSQAQRKDVSFCQPISPAVSSHIQPFAADNPVPPHFSIEEGIIKSLYFKKWSTGAGKTHREFHGVLFQCDDAPRSFSWQISGTRWGLHPLFYRYHPPFLAKGDRILAIYRRDNGNVQVLYNGSDGGAYLKAHPFYPGEQQMSQIYKVFYSIALVMFLFMFGLELNDMRTSDWDGWKFATESLDLLSLTLLCVGGVIALLELCGLATRMLSSRVGDWLTLQRKFKRYLGRTEANTTLQELM